MIKIIKIALLLAFIYFFALLFANYQNNHLVITQFKLSSPNSKNDIRIVQLSDLQCKMFGKQQKPLLDQIKALRPDIIVFTGDLVDAFHYDVQSWQILAAQLPKIAPTYFVSGNHEWWKGNFGEVEQVLTRFGTKVLRNETLETTIKNRIFSITGIDDPEAFQKEPDRYSKTIALLNDKLPNDMLSILLVHRSEYFKTYDQTRFSLIFAGHAHGGQFRLPLIGPILSPNQGYFPKYTAGMYTGKRTKMIVSRGLGNSLFPLRLFNYPEIVVVDI